MALASRSAAAIALMVLALPARGEVVTLLCQNREQQSSFTLRIDYDRKMVAEVNSDGSSRNLVPAKITEGDITWDHVFQNVEVFKGRFGRFRFSGSVNRLSGQGRVTYWRMDTEQPAWTVTGLCGRAAQKF